MKKLLFLALVLMSCFLGISAQESVLVKGPQGTISVTTHKPVGFIEGNKCPMVIFFHGLTGTKDDANFRLITAQLEQQGIATLVFDLTGCGATVGEFKKQTPKSFMKDCKAVIDYALKLPYVKNIGFCGFSYGAVLAILEGEEFGRDVKAMALLNPLTSIREDIIRGTLLGKKVDRTCDLDGTHTLGKDFIEQAEEINILKAAGKCKGDVLILQGKDDKFVPYTYGEYLTQVMNDAKFEQIKDIDSNFASADLDKHNKAITRVVEFLVKKLK